MEPHAFWYDPIQKTKIWKIQKKFPKMVESLGMAGIGPMMSRNLQTHSKPPETLEVNVEKNLTLSQQKHRIYT